MEYDLRRKVDGTANKDNPEYACLSWLPVTNPGSIQNTGRTRILGRKGICQTSILDLIDTNV